MSTAMVAATGSALALAAALWQAGGWSAEGGGAAAADEADGGPDGRHPAASRLLAALRDNSAGRRFVLALLAWAVATALAGAVAGLIAALGAVGGSVMRDRRAEALDRQRCEAATPAFARAMADALRGGASIRGALLAGTDDRAVPPALRTVLARETAGLGTGEPLLVVLVRLARAGGPAIRLLCGCVALHLESGGALASELERIAETAEAARKVEEDRTAATAQARATVRVVAALPLLAMAGAQLVSPGFLGAVAASPIALALLGLGLALEVAAVLAARVIVKPAS